MPMCERRISTSPTRGQPLPGSRASSAGNPVGTTFRRAALRPRQMAGCSNSLLRRDSTDMNGHPAALHQTRFAPSQHSDDDALDEQRLLFEIDTNRLELFVLG